MVDRESKPPRVFDNTVASCQARVDAIFASLMLRRWTVQTLDAGLSDSGTKESD